MENVYKILQIKTAIVIDNCAVYLYINNIKNERSLNMFNEYIPTGYKSWFEYNRAMERKEKRTYILQSIIVVVVFIGLMFFDSFINL